IPHHGGQASENTSFIAKLKTPAQNSGKTKIGQQVNIRLESFPEQEYGVLNGEVKNISVIPDTEGFYLMDVRLASKLMTHYKKKIVVNLQMRGIAEIVTGELRLIERFLYQFRNVFTP